MTTTYIYRDANAGSYGHEEERESTPETIEEDLRDWLREGDWGENESTMWVCARAWPLSAVDEDGDVLGDITEVTVAIDPEEPSCLCTRTEHAWRAPHSLLGGCQESPGVRGHGGGVIIREVCIACGCERITDTWAQNPDTGEQGLHSVSYETGAHDVTLCETCASHGIDTLATDTVGTVVDAGDGPVRDESVQIHVCDECDSEAMEYPPVAQRAI